MSQSAVGGGDQSETVPDLPFGTEATLRKMQHVQRPIPRAVAECQADPLQVDRKSSSKSLKSAPRGSALGLGGVHLRALASAVGRCGHLQVAVRSSVQCGTRFSPRDIGESSRQNSRHDDVRFSSTPCLAGQGHIVLATCCGQQQTEMGPPPFSVWMALAHLITFCVPPCRSFGCRTPPRPSTVGGTRKVRDTTSLKPRAGNKATR